MNVILVVVFLVCSAFFSACETAMTAYSRPKLYTLAKDGNNRARIILELQPEIELVISAILTCATILNAMTVAVTTNLLSEILGNYAIVLAPIITSVFIVLFAEVLPKMITISTPERILLPSAQFIKYTYIVMKPLNKIIGFIARNLIGMLHFAKTNKRSEYENSLDELRGAIDLHNGENVEDTQKEKEMLRSVLDLGEVTISNIMVHRKNVTMICADEPIEQIIDQIMNCPYTRVPLWSKERDNIIGVLHVKDLMKAIKRDEDIKKINISDIALKPRFVPENKDLLDQLQFFKTNHEHFALVVDEYGAFMGIVTLEDIIEEIVGDIKDEHDAPSQNGIRQQDDGSYIIDGSVNVRDLNREVGSNFKSDIASTVAGLIINTIGVIPDVGQIFVLYGYKFEILKRFRVQVTLVKLTKLGESNETK